MKSNETESGEKASRLNVVKAVKMKQVKEHQSVGVNSIKLRNNKFIGINV